MRARCADFAKKDSTGRPLLRSVKLHSSRSYFGAAGWKPTRRGRSETRAASGASNLSDCDGWVVCKLRDVCGICDIQWTLFADDERLV